MQMMVVWFIDYLELSHRDDVDITSLLVFLGRTYEQETIVNCVKIHDYLGIDFDFSEEVWQSGD